MSSNFNPDFHHRRSVRLPGYDYSRPGHYYVTICLRDIRCMLAVVHRGSGPHASPSLRLTRLGEVADRYWREIPLHFPHVVPDDYVIMPDHMHGILHLCRRAAGHAERGIHREHDEHDRTGVVEGTAVDVGIRHGVRPGGVNPDTGTPVDGCIDVSVNRIVPREPARRIAAFQRPIAGSLPVIVSQYKGAVRRWARGNGFPSFQWQRSFHDHVVRNEAELARIRRYIRDNPAKFLAGLPRQ